MRLAISPHVKEIAKMRSAVWFVRWRHIIVQRTSTKQV